MGHSQQFGEEQSWENSWVRQKKGTGSVQIDVWCVCFPGHAFLLANGVNLCG